MKYVKLGNSGVDVSRICLGMMSFGKPGNENGVFPWAMEFEDAKPLFRKAFVRNRYENNISDRRYNGRR